MDDYDTPAWVTEALLANYPLMAGNILEPCAGSGAIIEVLRRHRPGSRITAVEIRETERGRLKSLADRVHIADFLTWKPEGEYGTIITNPPFCIAQEVIERCFSFRPQAGEIVMLLRLGFLESKKRVEFWRKYPLSELLVITPRPSFDGAGSDKTAYGWFVWNSNEGQRIKVITRRAAS
jgi:hypothetical protein